MTNSELLDLLVDGELDSAQEAQLFNALASNAELRSEFGNLLAIRSNIHRDYSAFAPAAATTNAVFTRLNFAAPLAAPVTPVTPPAPTSSWSRFRVASVSAISASVITALLMLWLLPGISNRTGLADRNGFILQVRPVLPIPRALSLLSSMRSHTEPVARDHTNRVLAEAAPVRRIVVQQPGIYSGPEQRNHSRVTKSEAPSLIATAPSNAVPEITPVNVRKQTTDPAAVAPSYSPINTASPAPIPLLQTEQPEQTAQNEHYVLQARGLTAVSFPKIGVGAANATFPTEVSLGAFRSLSETYSIGLEVGRESFTQRFEGKKVSQIEVTLNSAPRYLISQSETSGRPVIYEQEPTVLWAALGVQRTFNAIGDFHPKAQLLIGGTELGPLAKLTIGGEYGTGTNLNVIFGLESSLLGYKFQDTWYTSRKFGITYGLSWHF